jgi:hypothetical protein
VASAAQKHRTRLSGGLPERVNDNETGTGSI